MVHAASPLAVVDLHLLPSFDFDSSNRKFLTTDKRSDVATNRVVLGGKTIVGNEVLIDPLGSETLLDLCNDLFAISSALATRIYCC